MSGRFRREDRAGRSSPRRSTWRSLAAVLVMAGCILLTLCFPVVARDVSGTVSMGEDGFREATLPPQYLAEGSTYGGMETWVVVFNPNNFMVTFDLNFYTEDSGADGVAGPQGVELAKFTRMSFRLNSLVPDKKDVSTRVISYGGRVICERSVYGPGRVWAHECQATEVTGATWYLAEGTTYGGMETWVVVFNPTGGDVTVELTFYTEVGTIASPKSYTIAGKHRQAFLLNSLVPDKKDVSTRVSSWYGEVVCERAVYGSGRAWAHDSVGVTNSAAKWYLAEGTTYGGMETWVVVFNPNPGNAIFDLTFYTDGGQEVAGPQNFSLPPGRRHSFLLNSLVPNKKDVSTVVSCDSGGVVCERAVYGPGRVWAHDSIGSTTTDSKWFLAEGTTYGGMETWVVVFNPGPGDATVGLNFYTEDSGINGVAGPQNVSIPKGHRQSFLLNSLVPNKKDVSTVVSASGLTIVCERAVYGPGRQWAHESLGAGYH